MARRDRALRPRPRNRAEMGFQISTGIARRIQVRRPTARRFRPFAIFARSIRFYEEFNGQRMKEARTGLRVFLGRIARRIIRHTFRINGTSINVGGRAFRLVRRQHIDLIMIIAVGTTEHSSAGQ